MPVSLWMEHVEKAVLNYGQKWVLTFLLSFTEEEIRESVQEWVRDLNRYLHDGLQVSQRRTTQPSSLDAQYTYHALKQALFLPKHRFCPEIELPATNSRDTRLELRQGDRERAVNMLEYCATIFC